MSAAFANLSAVTTIILVKAQSVADLSGSSIMRATRRLSFAFASQGSGQTAYGATPPWRPSVTVFRHNGHAWDTFCGVAMTKGWVNPCLLGCMVRTQAYRLSEPIRSKYYHRGSCVA